MQNWKDMAKRLRKNQERNLNDYAKQSSKSEERIEFLKQIEDEKAKILFSSRKKRDFEKTTVQEDLER